MNWLNYCLLICLLAAPTLQDTLPPTTSSTDLPTTIETTTEGYDPTVIPDLWHVQSYINDTIDDLFAKHNDHDLNALHDELQQIQSTEYEITSMMGVGSRQNDILKIVANVSENIGFCFDVIQDMNTAAHYNKTQAECLQRANVNATAIMAEYNTFYTNMVASLRKIETDYTACAQNNICKAKHVLILYDRLFTTPRKLDIGIREARTKFNNAINDIKMCTVEVTDYYTTIFDVVRQCVENVVNTNPDNVIEASQDLETFEELLD